MVELGKLFAIVGAIIAVLIVPFIIQILVDKKYKEYGIKILVGFCVIFTVAVVFAVAGCLMLMK
jgi:hypothetical protein